MVVLDTDIESFFFCCFNHVFCPFGFAVPESNQSVCVFCHFYIPFESCGLPIEIPVGREIDDLISMLFRISLSKPICSTSHTAHDLDIVIYIL